MWYYFPQCYRVLDQILNLPAVVKRSKSLDVVASANEVLSEGKILGTIILPKNLNVLSSRLPRANYRPAACLKKMPSAPGESREDRKVSSSSQQSRPLHNVQSGVLSPIDESCSRPGIPVSSPSSQDIQMAHNVKNRGVKPVIKSRKPERPAVQRLKNVRHYTPAEISRDAEGRLPMIRSPQVPRPVPIRRNIGSVDSAKRQEASRRLVELFRAHPVRNPLGVNVIDNKENGALMPQRRQLQQHYVRKPPLPLKYERMVIPLQRNAVQQAGRAVLERPHYNVLPQWWG